MSAVRCPRCGRSLWPLPGTGGKLPAHKARAHGAYCREPRGDGPIDHEAAEAHARAIVAAKQTWGPGSAYRLLARAYLELRGARGERRIPAGGDGAGEASDGEGRRALCGIGSGLGTEELETPEARV